jgi:hypothetical protein
MFYLYVEAKILKLKLSIIRFLKFKTRCLDLSVEIVFTIIKFYYLDSQKYVLPEAMNK